MRRRLALKPGLRCSGSGLPRAAQDHGRQSCSWPLKAICRLSRRFMVASTWPAPTCWFCRRRCPFGPAGRGVPGTVSTWPTMMTRCLRPTVIPVTTASQIRSVQYAAPGDTKDHGGARSRITFITTDVVRRCERKPIASRIGPPARLTRRASSGGIALPPSCARWARRAASQRGTAALRRRRVQGTDRSGKGSPVGPFNTLSFGVARPRT